MKFRPLADTPLLQAALIFAVVWTAINLFGSSPWNANSATRMFAAISLVEDGDATIDEFAPLTIDKGIIGDHYVSDKAPGAALMTTAAVAIVDLLERTSSDEAVASDRLEEYLTEVLHVAVALWVAPLTALASALLFLFTARLLQSRSAGLIVGLGYALATPTWAWSTTIFGHVPVGALLVVSLYAIDMAAREAESERRRLAFAFLAALALGWAIVIEHQAVFPAAALGLYGWWRVRSIGVRRLLALVGVGLAGGVAALVPLLAYNVVAFGSPLMVGYQGVVGFEGMQQGVFGLTYPHLEVLWYITLGRLRGILWLSPILVLAPFGWLSLWRNAGDEGRSTAVLCLVVTGIYWLINASYFYWDGGVSLGPRHVLPALPFLMIGVGALWAHARRAPLRWAVVGLGAFSGLISFLGADAGPHPVTERFPLFEHVFRKAWTGAPDAPSIATLLLHVQPGVAMVLYGLVLTGALPLLLRIVRVGSVRAAIAAVSR